MVEALLRWSELMDENARFNILSALKMPRTWLKTCHEEGKKTNFSVHFGHEGGEGRRKAGDA